MATSKITKTTQTNPSATPKTSKASASPNLVYLKNMAKNLGLTGYSRMEKSNLIHAIQEAEGYTACYKKVQDCSIKNCLFYPSCIG